MQKESALLSGSGAINGKQCEEYMFCLTVGILTTPANRDSMLMTSSIHVRSDNHELEALFRKWREWIECFYSAE